MQSLRHPIRIFLISLAVVAALVFSIQALAALTVGQTNVLETKAASGDKTALETLVTEAQKGDEYAQFILGTLYHHGKGIPQDYGQALQWYRKAAEQGSDVAQNNLGILYRNGEGVPKDDNQAAVWWRKAAEQGYATAQANLGVLYHLGQGVSQDDSQAAQWFRKAAEQGNTDAQFNLGVLYHGGKGVHRDDSQAARWWHKAAEKGDASAQTNLGTLYKNGWGVPQDYGQAALWWRKAAEQGDADAQKPLGFLYDAGQGVPEDTTLAAQWYHKAAEQGDAKAQYDLSVRYVAGRGVSQDYAQAMLWLRKAAEQGYTTAQSDLASLYAQGKRGVPRDYSQAALWYRKAAEQGDAGAQCSLGFLYKNGQGVRQDHAEAVQWFRKAAGQGNITAQFALGALYEKGQGVPQDYGQAAQWYRKVAEREGMVGVPIVAEARNSLGLLYVNGQGVPQDHAQAAQWFLKAAEGQNVEAWNNLALLYQNGQWVPRDYVEAAQWYREAAKQGHGLAQERLGFLHANGLGVPRSEVVAYALYSLSAKQNPSGRNPAWKSRSQLAKGMAEQEIKAGEVLAGEMSKPNNFDNALRQYLAQYVAPAESLLLQCDNDSFDSRRPPQNSTTNQNTSSHWAELPITFPKTAVSHIATYRPGRNPNRVVTITRHGALVRTESLDTGSSGKDEGKHTIMYSNLATGASVRTAISKNQQAIEASLRNQTLEKSVAGKQPYTLSRTGSEMIAGERCNIIFAEPSADDRAGVTHSACVTDDGVVLRDTAYYGSGKVMSESVAVKVERVPVDEQKVLPPRDLLDWAKWDNLPITKDSIWTAQKNYTLMLVATKEIKNASMAQTLKADTVSSSEIKCLNGIMDTLWIAAPKKQLSFISERMLSITMRQDYSPLKHFRNEAPLPKPDGWVLKESCQWTNTGVNVADYSRTECRTNDGLPLLVEERSMGGGANWVATKLERGRNSPGSIAPPSGLLNWDYWGWPQLATKK
ncbi:MAG: SEL1-like repeat protein [Azonexus sp.]|uniref:tetratricopeptide repeat protein n=1 Tax=Azonexus sp. TaxID=1872668 RepID=UPI00282E0471|nr:SEL1-like repeat protein [Azonexus sp.]MDR0775065.1 SEL1-like repeat protein [Azonexus sp.]